MGAALVGGAVALSLVAGGGASWAWWTATAQASAAIATPAVRISHVDFASLDAVYTNDLSTLDRTGSFRLSNDGDVDGIATVRLSSEQAPAATLGVVVWEEGGMRPCAPETPAPPDAATGSWESVSLDGIAIAAGSSTTMCVRTSVAASDRNALAHTSGSVVVEGVLSATLAGDGTGWTATAPAAAATHETRAIFPLDPALVPLADSAWFDLRTAGATGDHCLDVSGGGGAGTRVISWECTPSPADAAFPSVEQFWQLIPVEGAERSLVSLRPRHAPTTRLTVDADGHQIIDTADPSSPSQQWHLQRVSGTRIQLVSAATGLCLHVPRFGVDDLLSTVDCTDQDAVLVAPKRYPLKFYSSLSGTEITVGPAVTGANLSFQLWSGTTWQPVELSATSRPKPLASVLEFYGVGNLASGVNRMRLVFPDGSVAYTFTVRWTASLAYADTGFG